MKKVPECGRRGFFGHGGCSPQLGFVSEEKTHPSILTVSRDLKI